MAKTKKNSKTLPIRSSAQIKEDDSKLIFNKIMKPWMVREMPKDFGIDASVEITRPLSNSNQALSGKKFSVQLKSSSVDKFDKKQFSLPIPREKINYAHELSEPFLLVYVDLKTENCYYRWIDEKLIQELFATNKLWIAQETVSIIFDKNKTINPETLVEIERYVLNYKRNPKSILTPGNYFKYSQEVKKHVDEFHKLTRQFNVNFLSNDIDTLKNSTSDPIFTIAVAGPTKAGKSTLINCILQKEILPIGRLPTTGIPITIYPSTENKCSVTFKDNSTIEGDGSVAFIGRYTTQKENNKNIKDVKLVTVEIVNTLLEKGFAICDMPGIDDADVEIREITQTALCNADAIIYVVSVAPYATGDFSISGSIIDDINSLGGEMKKLFLVFSKIDVLTVDDLNALKEHITGVLTEYEILQYLPIEPLYISSKESVEYRKVGKIENDSVSTLENKIWEYFLSQNKTGLYKLIDGFSNCLNLFDQIKTLLHARMAKTEKRYEIEAKVGVARNEIANFDYAIEQRKDSIYQFLQQHLLSSLQGIINYLRDHLNTFTLDQNLPTNKSIVKWLENYANNIFFEVDSLLRQEASKLQSDINDWIREQLNLISINIDSENSGLSFENLQQYSNPINYVFHPNIAHNGIKRVFAEIDEVIMSIITIVEDAFTSKVIVREKQIHEMTQKSAQAYNIIYQNFLFNLNSRINYVCHDLKMKSIDRAEVYLDDLSKQLSLLDQPLTAYEHDNFISFLNEVRSLETSIKSNQNHLRDYTLGIV